MTPRHVGGGRILTGLIEVSAVAKETATLPSHCHLSRGVIPVSEDQIVTQSNIIGLVTLVVVGIALWAVNTYLPMDHTIKSILNIVVLILVILWLLRGFGSLGDIGAIRVGT